MPDSPPPISILWRLCCLGLLTACGAPSAVQQSSGPETPTTRLSTAPTEPTESEPERTTAEFVSVEDELAFEGPDLLDAESPPLETLTESEYRRHARRVVNRARRILSPPRRAVPSTALGTIGHGSAAGSSPEQVTNNQVAGVDEGGIVKRWGDYLVVLRRGRLFTARLTDDAPEPVAFADVQTTAAPDSVWYDELIVHQDTGRAVVIGYSYERSGTLLALFQIQSDGTLRREQRAVLRSNDYYSSRNYSSRLVGDDLVFYAPNGVVHTTRNDRVQVFMPAIQFEGSRRWQPTVGMNLIHRLPSPAASETLHTVTKCNLRSSPLQCETSGFLGGEGHVFYVSARAVYVWIRPSGSEWEPDRDPTPQEEERFDAIRAMPSRLVRLPLNGDAPEVVLARGTPIDQFSFHETEDTLFVAMRPQGWGSMMWASEIPTPALAMARIPLSAFSNSPRRLGSGAYRPLALDFERRQSLVNRFVGRYFIYGTGPSWGRPVPMAPGTGRAYLHEFENGTSHAIALDHAVSRVEAMGDGAVLVGNNEDTLHFQAIGLGASPSLGDNLAEAGSSQGETRSHGFFYRPTTSSSGILGLPTRSASQPGHAQLRQGSAGITYLAVNNLRFSRLGSLDSSSDTAEDNCQVSCTDWYGNARPLFLGERIFALLGYEIVEGQVYGPSLRQGPRTNLLSLLPLNRR